MFFRLISRIVYFFLFILMPFTVWIVIEISMILSFYRCTFFPIFFPPYKTGQRCEIIVYASFFGFPLHKKTLRRIIVVVCWQRWNTWLHEFVCICQNNMIQHPPTKPIWLWKHQLTKIKLTQSSQAIYIYKRHRINSVVMLLWRQYVSVSFKKRWILAAVQKSTRIHFDNDSVSLFQFRREWCAFWYSQC